MKSSVSGPGKIRQLNRKAVLNHIRQNRRNSRSNIGKELGLSPAAMTSVVNELLNEGLLKDAETIQSKEKSQSLTNNRRQGRPISYIELNPDAACVYGILLRPIANTCHIEAAWGDYAGRIHPLKSSIDVDIQQVQLIVDGIKKALSVLEEHVKKTQNAGNVCGLTIGIPGVVEVNNIPMAPKLMCIEGTEFMATLKQDLPYPVSFENDVNLGALSELWQQPRLRHLSFAYLHVYSGVGSSIVLNGNILNGSRGWAGEIGHLSIQHSDKRRTSFEQLLSVDGALAELLQSLGHKPDNFDQLVSYIKKKNTKVLKITNQYGTRLFEAINVLHSVLDLDEVVIDFPSLNLFNELLPKIEQLLDQLPHKVVISTPSIEHQADLHGAALKALSIALDKIEQRQVPTLSK